MIRSKTRTLLASEGTVKLADFLGFSEPFTTVILRGGISTFVGDSAIDNSNTGLPISTRETAINTGLLGSPERVFHFDHRSDPAENLYIRTSTDAEVTVFAY